MDGLTVSFTNRSAYIQRFSFDSFNEMKQVVIGSYKGSMFRLLHDETTIPENPYISLP